MTNWSEYATSFTYDEKNIIEWIIKLHNNNKPFDLDPTFSIGKFWQGFTEPRLKFDLAPQRSDVICADSRALPLESNSVGSIMFDPPFLVGGGIPGIMKKRFSRYKDIPELWQFYKDSLNEFWRLLKPNGILSFKCQDVVSSQTNHMTHAFVINEGQRIGYYVKDLYVLGRHNVMWSPNMANQEHARKNHCYYLVLQKTKMNAQKNRAILTSLDKIK